ncbi:beta-lactamase/transpeptidase-like protein [Acephala macrosclerotiorum]|nr:beta-lactamase/transpeptidase-like protein [Acephala macrosclerotiorum]
MGEAPDSTRPELLEALQSTLEAGIDAGVPALSAAISTSKGIIWESSAGVTDIKTQKLIDTSNLFGIGSITKVFVSVVILQLVDEKFLKISDIVSQYLDENVIRGIENADTATIGSLLSHTGGVESWEDDPKWIVEGRGKELDPDRIWGKTDTLEYIRRPSSLTRGKFSYANTNFTLLGLIIERITGRSAESVIRRRILEHLGLKDTYLEGFDEMSKEKLEKVPHRYHWATEAFRSAAGICPNFSDVEWKQQSLIDATSSNLSVEWVAGGMITSPSDLLKFAISLRDGKLLSPSSMAALKDWQPATAEREVGNGLMRFHSPFGYGTWLGHNGSVLGFTGALWWKEDADCAVCILANVGTMHAGKVPSSAPDVLIKSEFLGLAPKLAAL